MPILNFERVNSKIWGVRGINLHIILVIYNFFFLPALKEIQKVKRRTCPHKPQRGSDPAQPTGHTTQVRLGLLNYQEQGKWWQYIIRDKVSIISPTANDKDIC